MSSSPRSLKPCNSSLGIVPSQKCFDRSSDTRRKARIKVSCKDGTTGRRIRRNLPRFDNKPYSLGSVPVIDVSETASLSGSARAGKADKVIR
jgi:hypothetical protein